MQRVICARINRLKKFCLPGSNGDMAEPTVFLRAVPMPDAFVGDNDIARMQRARRLSRLLISARASGDKQNLIAIGMNMPVIATAGFKGDVGGR